MLIADKNGESHWERVSVYPARGLKMVMAVVDGKTRHCAIDSNGSRVPGGAM